MRILLEDWPSEAPSVHEIKDDKKGDKVDQPYIPYHPNTEEPPKEVPELRYPDDFWDKTTTSEDNWSPQWTETSSAPLDNSETGEWNWSQWSSEEWDDENNFSHDVHQEEDQPQEDWSSSRFAQENFRKSEVFEEGNLQSEAQESSQDFIAKWFTIKNWDENEDVLSSPKDITDWLTNLPEGESTAFRIAWESWIEDIEIENRNGNMILNLPEGEFKIDTSGEKGKEMMLLIASLLETPILRRLISMWNGYFNEFVKKLNLRNQWKDILDPPEEFKNLSYELLFSSLPENDALREPILNKLHTSTNFANQLSEHPETIELLRTSLRGVWIIKPAPSKEIDPHTFFETIDKIKT